MSKIRITIISIIVVIIMFILVITLALNTKKTTSQYPSGFFEGELIQCADNNKLYKLQDGQKSPITTMQFYIANNSKFITIPSCSDISGIPDGPKIGP